MTRYRRFAVKCTIPHNEKRINIFFSGSVWGNLAKNGISLEECFLVADAKFSVGDISDMFDYRKRIDCISAEIVYKDHSVERQMAKEMSLLKEIDGPIRIWGSADCINEYLGILFVVSTVKSRDILVVDIPHNNNPDCRSHDTLDYSESLKDINLINQHSLSPQQIDDCRQKWLQISSVGSDYRFFDNSGTVGHGSLAQFYPRLLKAISPDRYMRIGEIGAAVEEGELMENVYSVTMRRMAAEKLIIEKLHPLSQPGFSCYWYKRNS